MDRSGPTAAGEPGGPRRVLDLLGLAARARVVVAGTDAVRRAAREGKVRRVLLAEDAAAAQLGKLRPLLDARAIPYHVRFSQAELGGAIGRDPVSAVGLVDEQFARRVGELLQALPSLQDQVRRK